MLSGNQFVTFQQKKKKLKTFLNLHQKLGEEETGLKKKKRRIVTSHAENTMTFSLTKPINQG